MASTIVTKNSSTASAVPLTGDLTQGELAVNVTDKRLFTKNSGGTVVELGINPSSLTMSGGTANGVAYLNGSKVLTTGSALTFDGTTVSSPVVQSTNGTITTVLSYSGGNSTGVVGTTSNHSLEFRQNNTEQMRLTSTGLGIGTSSPGAKLDVDSGSTGLMGLLNSTNANGGYITGRSSGSAIWDLGTAKQALNVGGASDFGINVRSGFLSLGTGNTERMRLDSSGNLGLGVTPSAWSTYTALQVKTASLWSGNSLNSFASLTANAYYQGGYKYIASDYATEYYQYQGAHVWRTAASGTAGNAITFTQAMTLDASGRLGIGTTSPGSLIDAQSATALCRLTSTTGTNEVSFRAINTGGTFYIGRDNSGGTSFGAAYAAALWSEGAYPMIFATSNTERARIDSSGNLLVGTTSLAAGTAHTFQQTTANNYTTIFKSSRSTAAQNYGLYVYYDSAAPNGTGNEFLQCQDNAAVRATIRSNGGLANYSGNDVNLSDRREKTNFAPAGEYLSKICAIPVQTFNYIDQSEDDPGLTLGVVAQDVQAVAPELVMESNWGTKDEPKMRLSIYQTDLQYALMKCIQEQQALIQQLQADVAALKGN